MVRQVGQKWYKKLDKYVDDTLENMHRRIRGVFIGSMGSEKPINFQRGVLEPFWGNLRENQHFDLNGY